MSDLLGISRCGKIEHIDLAIKCSRRRHNYVCIQCIGCLLEGVDDCGALVYLHYEGDEKPNYKLIEKDDDGVFLTIPEISEAYLKIIYKIAKEAQKFRLIKKIITGA